MSKQLKIVIPLDSNPVPYPHGIRSVPVFAAGKFKYINHYKTTRLKDFQDWVRMHARSAKNKHGFEIIEKFFKVDLYVVFKTRNHGDMDNVEKSIMDALQGEVFENDKWACDKRVHYSYGKNSRIEIIIEKTDLP